MTQAVVENPFPETNIKIPQFIAAIITLQSSFVYSNKKYIR